MFNAVFSRLDAADKPESMLFLPTQTAFSPRLPTSWLTLRSADTGSRMADGAAAHVNGQVMRLELADGNVLLGESLPAGARSHNCHEHRPSTWRRHLNRLFGRRGCVEAVVDTDIPYLCTAEITVKYDGSGVPSIRFKLASACSDMHFNKI